MPIHGGRVDSDGHFQAFYDCSGLRTISPLNWTYTQCLLTENRATRRKNIDTFHDSIVGYQGQAIVGIGVGLGVPPMRLYQSFVGLRLPKGPLNKRSFHLNSGLLRPPMSWTGPMSLVAHFRHRFWVVDDQCRPSFYDRRG